MSDKIHLGILKQGVHVWNAWRKTHPGLMPDLSGTSLKGADLYEANLAKCDLSRADLAAANLIGADLSGANLCEANLRGTLLVRAHLALANLAWATLIEAVITRATFDRARFSYTVFANVDLSQARGLEKAQHGGPSYLSVETIYQSGGKIPKVFLVGCGVPNEMMAMVDSFAERPLRFCSCFISYSNKDRAFAQRLHTDLSRKGVRVWFAPVNLNIGDPFRPRIEEAIRMHDRLLLVLSKHSIGSRWVADEVEAAFEKERKERRTVLFPVRLDTAVMRTELAWAAQIRRTRQIGDMTGWRKEGIYRKALERLVNDLQEDIGD